MEMPLVLVITAGIILLGFFGDILFRKTNIPSVLWLTILGLLLGPVFHVVNVSSFIGITELIATFAIIIILFEGGIGMDLYKILREASRATLLSITGFVFSMLGVAALSLAFGFNIMQGLLLGAIVGGTSSPIVIPIVSKLTVVRDKVKIILAIESAITDVLCIVAAIVIIESSVGNGGINVFGSLASAFSIGIVFGVFTGLVWLPVMKRLAYEAFSYVVTLAMLFLLYAGTQMAGGSGAIACLLFGIILANGKKIYGMIQQKAVYELDDQTKQFHVLITFFIRTFFFVYLGLLVTIQEMWLLYAGIATAVVLIFMRILAVKVSGWRTDFTSFEEKIMVTMMPRGLAAAVLAYIPISRGVPGAEGFPSIVFTVILATVVICTISTALLREKPKQVLQAVPKVEKSTALKSSVKPA